MTEPNDNHEEAATQTNGATSASGEQDAASVRASTAPAAATGTAGAGDGGDPIAAAKADVERFRDQWMRTAADFDNYRKRARREVDDARKGGREDLLKEMLPVFDNLERALTSSKGATDVKGVVDGLTMILKQFDSTLGKVGISRVPSVGVPFDPSLHEAIQQIETDEHPPGTVVAEVQPGYMAGEKLIRAAMVVVAKPKSSSDAAS